MHSFPGSDNNINQMAHIPEGRELLRHSAISTALVILAVALRKNGALLPGQFQAEIRAELNRLAGDLGILLPNITPMNATPTMILNSIGHPPRERTGCPLGHVVHKGGKGVAKMFLGNVADDGKLPRAWTSQIHSPNSMRAP